MKSRQSKQSATGFSSFSCFAATHTHDCASAAAPRMCSFNSSTASLVYINTLTQIWIFRMLPMAAQAQLIDGSDVGFFTANAFASRLKCRIRRRLELSLKTAVRAIDQSAASPATKTNYRRLFLFLLFCYFAYSCLEFELLSFVRVLCCASFYRCRKTNQRIK